MNLNNRLLELIKILNMSQTKFAELMGWSKQNAQHYFKSDSKLRAEQIIIMKNKIPSLNLNWFLFGEGNPLYMVMDIAEENSYEHTIRQDMIRILEKQLDHAHAETAHNREQIRSLTKIIEHLTNTDK